MLRLFCILPQTITASTKQTCAATRAEVSQRFNADCVLYETKTHTHEKHSEDTLLTDMKASLHDWSHIVSHQMLCMRVCVCGGVGLVYRGI